MISINTIAALTSLVINLSSSIALTANTTNEIISWKASACSNCSIPNLVGFTCSSANTIDWVIRKGRRTNSTRVTDKVVSRFADTFSINIIFIRIACQNAKAEITYITSIANTRFCCNVISWMKRASSTWLISHLEILWETNTWLCRNIEYSFAITRNSADT